MAVYTRDFERVDKLKEYILSEKVSGEIVSELKTKTGKADFFTVFLSVCNKKTRAKVFHGSGTSLSAAWTSAADALGVFAKRAEKKRENMDDVWVKADVVISREEIPTVDLNKIVVGIKWNNFTRVGISFDPGFKNAFLEAELNANKIITYYTEKEIAGRKYDYNKNLINLENLNIYRQKVYNGLPIYSVPERVTIFNTRGFFCGEDDVIHELYNDVYDHGRRKIDVVDDKIIKEVIVGASNFLANEIGPDGRFRYGYFPVFDNEISGYNIVRHASTLWSLINLYRMSGDEKIIAKIDAGIKYLESEIEQKDDDTAYLVERNAGEVKLGGNGVAIVMYTEYMDVFKSDKYIEMVRKLGNGILELQNPETGKYWHILSYPGFERKEELRTVYYDGEATFALARAYTYTKEQKFLDGARLAVEYFIDNNYIKHQDHWVAYALFEVTKYVEDVRFYEFALQNADKNLKPIYERQTSFHTYLEMLMASWRTYKRALANGVASDYVQNYDPTYFAQTIYRRARHMLNGYFYPEYAMYMKAPEKIVGSFMVRHHNYRVRIDDIQHFIGGYYFYSVLYGEVLEWLSEGFVRGLVGPTLAVSSTAKAKTSEVAAMPVVAPVATAFKWLKIQSLGAACIGCGACFNVCKKTAITMKSESDGVEVPVVDEKKCTRCGRCDKACPIVKSQERQKKTEKQIAPVQSNNSEHKGVIFYGITANLANRIHGFIKIAGEPNIFSDRNDKVCNYTSKLLDKYDVVTIDEALERYPDADIWITYNDPYNTANGLLKKVPPERIRFLSADLEYRTEHLSEGVKNKMIYHLNVSFGKNLNGLDHAAITRFKMFKRHGLESKIITAKYNIENNNIETHSASVGIQDSDIISIYDYYQNITGELSNTPIKLNSVFPSDNFKIIKTQDSQANNYKIYYNGVYVALVHCDNDEVILYINYFDAKKRKIKRSFYDCRGFLSSEKILDETRSVLMEIFYTPNGEKMIEKFYKNEEEKNVLTLIKVKDKFGKLHFLSSEDDFITLFLDDIINEKVDTLIVDKNQLYDKPVINMSKRVNTIAVIHSSHLRGRDALKSAIKNCYKQIFENIEKFDAVITSTQTQREEVVKRFPNYAKKIHGIPVSFRLNVPQVAPTNEIKIIIVARLVREKRLEDSVKAFGIIVNAFPKAELHIFGSGGKETELRKLSSNLGIEKNVFFRGYVSDLSGEYATSKVLLLSSIEEGFCQALMEAISHGIPAVSYNIKYGPSDLIENGKSGFLTSETPEDLADKVIALLTDSKLYEEFSDAAYKKSFDFSEESAIEKWKSLINNDTFSFCQTFSFDEYRESLARYKNDFIIIITAMDTPVNKKDPINLRAIGSKQNLEYRNSFIFISNCGNVIFDEQSGETINFNFDFSFGNISVKSSGFSSGSNASIKINGIEKCQNIRGLNIIVMKPTGEIVDNCTFEVLRKIFFRIDSSFSPQKFQKKKIEIAFLPYKASMWDSLESIWLAAKDDPDCNISVVPIPYYTLNADRTFRDYHYEGTEYPDYVPIVPYESYNLSEKKPDIIYIHNPFDHRNSLTSVEPKYYSYILKRYTDMLVYSPYYGGFANDGKYDFWKNTLNKKSLDFIDIALASSPIPTGTPKNIADKFVVLGSPKTDKIISTKRENCEIPSEWKNIIENKKIVLYNTHLNNIASKRNIIDKLKYVFDVFSKRNDVLLWWRPHPLSVDTFRSLNPEMLDDYCRVVDEYKKLNFGIYDETNDVNRAIAFSDAYYGDDTSSIIHMYALTGKPILAQKLKLTDGKNNFNIRAYPNFPAENTSITLEYFIDYIVSNKKFDTKEQINFDAFIKNKFINVDGTCGKQIHNHAKQIVNDRKTPTNE